MDRPAFLELALLQAVMEDDIPEAVDLAGQMLPTEVDRLIYQVRKMESLLWIAKVRLQEEEKAT